MNDCMTQEDAMNMNNEQAVSILIPLRDMMRDQYGCPISDAYFALDKAIEALKQLTQPNTPNTLNALDTISRQAAIDALDKRFDSIPMEQTTEILLLRKDLKNLPAAQPEQRWIPCSERLPEEENKSYWICTDGGYQCECRWTNVNHFWTNLTTDWHWHIMDVSQYSKVVAWMPLPEPYKEGEHE